MNDETTGPTGRIKQKLIDSKQRWARDGRLLTGKAGDRARDRLPPGQREVKDWPVLDLGLQPRIDRETWRLAVDGLVARPLSLDWAGFTALAMADSVSDVHCVTAWSRFANRWRGVPTGRLLAEAQPLAHARFVVCHSADGYATNLPLAAFAAEDALLAVEWDGRPLPREHGGPVRVVVPRLYFWKSAKWVTRIELLAEDRPGFWEVRGYHNNGDPWQEERYGV